MEKLNNLTNEEKRNTLGYLVETSIFLGVGIALTAGSIYYDKGLLDILSTGGITTLAGVLTYKNYKKLI